MKCLLCRSEFAEFLPYGIPARMGRCPACGSKGRLRALALLVRERLGPRLKPGADVLEIGPSKIATERLAPIWNAAGARYTAVDLRALQHCAALRLPNRFARMDVGRLAFRDGTFDVVLCCNVLQFVRDDAAALREIRRVLRPGGLAVVPVHLSEGPTETAEAYRRRLPEAEADLFLEENGTAWYYGDDYGDRLRAAGLESMPIEPGERFSTEERILLGLTQRPVVTVAAADRPALERWLAPA